jgi:hypothetical protein
MTLCRVGDIDAMTLHVFRSISVPELYGFTADAAGANLPVETGPWAAAGEELPLGTAMAAKSPEIDQEIEANGYALVENRRSSQPLLPRTDSKP